MFWFLIWVLLIQVSSLSENIPWCTCDLCAFQCFTSVKHLHEKCFSCCPRKWPHHLLIALNCSLKYCPEKTNAQSDSQSDVQEGKYNKGWDGVYWIVSRKRRCYRAMKGRTFWKQLTRLEEELGRICSGVSPLPPLKTPRQPPQKGSAILPIHFDQQTYLKKCKFLCQN